MDLLDFMNNIKQMLEEDNKQLEQCVQERKTREVEKEARRVEKEKDLTFILEKLGEIQDSLAILKAVRGDETDLAPPRGDQGEDSLRAGNTTVETAATLLQGALHLESPRLSEMSFKVPWDVSRPLLITPSASPPPRSLTSKVDVAPPPPKRQRLTSVSRSSSLRRSVSVSDAGIDIQKEREASRARLLDTWSQLAERYSRPLDEDDIVDIRTGEIVKDNGFWRTTRQFRFGEVLAPDSREENVADESEDEDGIDELDAFPEEHDFLEDVFARGLQKVSAPDEGSGDEDDLEDFLEAEQRRKEEFGSDIEEEELAVSSGQPAERTHPDISNELVNELEDEDEDEETVGGSHDVPGTSSSYDSAAEYSGSEDELDNWEPTEASRVIVACEASESLSVDEGSGFESEIEIVDEPPSFPQILSLRKRTPATQLQSPPHSYTSSVDQPITGCIEISLPPPPSTPARSAGPQAARQARSTLCFAPEKQPIKIPKYHITTAQQRANNSLEVIDITDDDEETESQSYTAAPSPSPPPSPPLSPIKRVRSRLVPEVVITTPPPRMSRIKDTIGESPSKPKSTSPVKSTKQTIISEALSKTASPMKTPRKTMPLVPGLKASPAKKPTQKTESTETLKKSEMVPSSRKRLPSRRTPSSLHEDQERDKRNRNPSAPKRTLSPEIGDRPASPDLSTVRSSARRASSSPPNTRVSRKRKRSSSQHEKHAHPSTPEKLSKEATGARYRPSTPERSSGSHRQPQRSNSKSGRPTPAADVDSSSSDEEDRRDRHATRRSASVSMTMQSTQPPFSTPQHPPGAYPPVADPRAQQIITSAMQQLAALLWTPPTHSNSSALMYPYTPTHHRYSSVGPSLMHSTPNHPHPYPFSFDPSFSRATLPPSSPEPPSSPVKPRERKKSLVSRSHSRGRRVSFCVNDSREESDSGSSASEQLQLTSKQRRGRKDRSLSPQQSQNKGKGKAVERFISLSESEEEGDHDESWTNFSRAKSARAQTPGPETPVKEGASSSSSRLRLLNKGTSKRRANNQHHGGSND
ncbi:hypothetical protein NP233_g5509 [Leucocoprinus birnbaumii]|uniref:Uncharacterized protein n=1 Tax=Leucocoprinus birnbaumii TaxID=56174 RepID=A0AAD5VT55_9AGAR|nr:hypothetical protein NP233_g5509 [Leucocoprinus birnbaumii]